MDSRAPGSVFFMIAGLLDDGNWLLRISVMKDSGLHGLPFAPRDQGRRWCNVRVFEDTVLNTLNSTKSYSRNM